MYKIMRNVRCRLINTSLPVLFVACLYTITFCFVLPRACVDKIYSPYFRLEESGPDIVSDAYHKNSLRFHEASAYISQLLAAGAGIPEFPEVAKKNSHGKVVHRGLSSRDRGSGPDIAIGITSVQRSVEKDRAIRVGYLTQVIATLHRLRKIDKNFKHIHIFICNVDRDGTYHREATYLSTVVDTYIKYNSEDEANRFSEPWQIFEKEKQDYQFCLETSLMYRADYTIILEDDALPKETCFSVLHTLLKEEQYSINNRALPSLDSESLPVDWAFMKLYHPEKWAGYGSEVHQWLELVCGGVLGAVIFVIAWILYLQLIASPRRNAQPCWRSHLVAFLFGAVYIILLAKMVGRPYIIDYIGETLNWHWVISGRQCCTQAVLYPSVVINNLVQYLETKDCNIDYSIDHVLEDFLKDRSLKSYLVEPNLVRHIGMFSSLRSYAKRAAEFI